MKVNWNNLIKQINKSMQDDDGHDLWTYEAISTHLRAQGIEPCSKTTIGRLAVDPKANPKWDMGYALIELHRQVTQPPEAQSGTTSET